MKKIGFFFIFAFLSLFAISCDKVRLESVRGLTENMPYYIEITVSIEVTDDPTIYIKAKDIEIDRVKKEIFIKGAGYISDSNDSFAIKVEDAKFSIPLGGKITIKKDGVEEVLESYPGSGIAITPATLMPAEKKEKEAK